MAACVLLACVHRTCVMRPASWSADPGFPSSGADAAVGRCACVLPAAVGARPASSVAVHTLGAELRKVRKLESHADAAITICRLGA